MAISSVSAYSSSPTAYQAPQVRTTGTGVQPEPVQPVEAAERRQAEATESTQTQNTEPTEQERQQALASGRNRGSFVNITA